MVDLINKSGRIKVYNLDHPFFRTRKWGTQRTTTTVIEESADGRRNPRQLRRVLPGSLTIRAGKERKGLPDQIQAVPAIRKDIRAGLLEVKKYADPKPEAPKEAASKSKRGSKEG